MGAIKIYYQSQCSYNINTCLSERINKSGRASNAIFGGARKALLKDIAEKFQKPKPVCTIVQTVVRVLAKKKQTVK